MEENKAELNEEVKVLSPYGENRGKVTVVDEDGFKHKTELSRKQWLTKDLKDYFLSGLGSLKFDDIRVARGIDFSKEAVKMLNPNDISPWDIIDCGLNKDWLINEYNKAKNAQNTISITLPSESLIPKI